MSSYSDRDTNSQPGDWLLSAMRRNPEALLLMAAGEVADTFKEAMSDKRAGSGASPGGPDGMSGSGQNVGMDQNRGGASHGPHTGTGRGSVR